MGLTAKSAWAESTFYYDVQLTISMSILGYMSYYRQHSFLIVMGIWKASKGYIQSKNQYPQENYNLLYHVLNIALESLRIMRPLSLLSFTLCQSALKARASYGQRNWSVGHVCVGSSYVILDSFKTVFLESPKNGLLLMSSIRLLMSALKC